MLCCGLFLLSGGHRARSGVMRSDHLPANGCVAWSCSASPPQACRREQADAAGPGHGVWHTQGLHIRLGSVTAQKYAPDGLASAQTSWTRRSLRTSATCPSAAGATPGRGISCPPTAWATGACAARWTAPTAPTLTLWHRSSRRRARLWEQHPRAMQHGRPQNLYQMVKNHQIPQVQAA